MIYLEDIRATTGQDWRQRGKSYWSTFLPSCKVSFTLPGLAFHSFVNRGLAGVCFYRNKNVFRGGRNPNVSPGLDCVWPGFCLPSQQLALGQWAAGLLLGQWEANDVRQRPRPPLHDHSISHQSLSDPVNPTTWISQNWLPLQTCTKHRILTGRSLVQVVTNFVPPFSGWGWIYGLSPSLRDGYLDSLNLAKKHLFTRIIPKILTKLPSFQT